MTDEHGPAFLLVDRARGRSQVVVGACERLLYAGHAKATPSEQVVHAAPARSVDENAVHEDDADGTSRRRRLRRGAHRDQQCSHPRSTWTQYSFLLRSGQKQPDVKDKLKESFTAAKNLAAVEVYPAKHGWCVPDMPMEGGAAIRAGPGDLAGAVSHCAGLRPARDIGVFRG